MQVIRNIKYWLLLAAVAGCIEPFNPEIEEYQKLLVISGKITNYEGFQYVEVSRSSSYNDPANVREKNCNVKVYDDRGNIFQYEEYTPGNYRCWIGQEYLSINSHYRVEVVTKDSKIYASGYDIMEPCPDIEDITYEVKSVESDDPIMNATIGIQLYISTKESEREVTNLRWEVDETWEYHAANLVSDYYDGTINYMEGVLTDTLRACWKNGRVRDIMTMSTKNYISNKITRGPLTFIADNKEKLQVKYSALVKQYSLSDSAFEYWNKMQQNLQEAGGLYDTQPIRITGNVYCVSNPEETVLGYFWATEVKEQRFFFRNTGQIPFNYSDCQPYNYTSEQLMEHLSTFTEEEYPVFLINLSGLADGPWDLTDQWCFDCTKKGGTLVKPDFWQ